MGKENSSVELISNSPASRASLWVFFVLPFCRKMAVDYFMHEKVWFEKYKYDDAERRFYEQMNGPVGGSSRQQVRAASQEGVSRGLEFRRWYRAG